MNTKVRKKAKTEFEKDFFKLMNAVLVKTVENVRKHRDFQLVTTERRETIWYQSQIITLQIFSQKIYLQYIWKRTK